MRNVILFTENDHIKLVVREGTNSIEIKMDEQRALNFQQDVNTTMYLFLTEKIEDEH